MPSALGSPAPDLALLCCVTVGKALPLSGPEPGTRAVW